MKKIAIRNIQRAPLELNTALGKLGATTAHEAQAKTGCLDSAIRPIFSGARIAGSAVTVLTEPGDNWMIHVAIELCQVGDILVVATTAQDSCSLFGDLLATSAQSRGVLGLVIDAGVRDVRELKEMNFPVWSRSISPQGPVREQLGSVNVPIRCGGQLINPGDTVIADDDGVVVVRREQTQVVFEAAKIRVEHEQEKRDKFAAGVLGLDLYNMREHLEEAGLQYLESEDELE